MDDGWYDGHSVSICAMHDQIKGLRNRVREQCDTIRQLTDQLQQRTDSLCHVEQQLTNLRTDFSNLKNHLERERFEKHTLYYKNIIRNDDDDRR